MFGFLKDKLKKVISNVADRIRKKPVEKEEQEVEEIKKKEEEKELKQEVKEVEEIKEFGVEEAEKEKEEKKPEKKSFFQKLINLTKVKLSDDDFDELFSQLEITMMENNVSIDVIDSVKTKLRKELLGKPISRKEIENEIKSSLRNALNEILIEPFDFIERVKSKKPYVIVFFGINGSGKTTTIARIAHLLKKNKLSCVLSASDTFRAASIEQLQKHADKLNVKMIKHQYNADPAAVAFDAVSYAKSHSIDAVLIDTAGRMHTSSNLMKEMEKIVRVSKPDMKIFVGEAIIGNDAVEQAKSFNDSIGIDGIILCKADVDEKGGASISVSKVTGKPVLFLGVGQEYDDLEKFNKDKIIKSLGL